MVYKILIEPEVFVDIQQAIDWYNSRQKGLGKRFHGHIIQQFKVIRKNPLFQIRYDDIRCMPVPKFPYMIHFTVDQQNKLITVRAVFNTFRDPNSWYERT